MPKYIALTRIKYNDDLIEADETFECSKEDGHQLVEVQAAKFLNNTRKRRVVEVAEVKPEDTEPESPTFL